MCRRSRAATETVRTEAATRPHFVAFAGGVIVGLTAVRGNEIRRLYVDPTAHRRGIGRALFAVAEEQIRGAGHGAITLDAHRSAVAFYEAMGMRVAGEVAWPPELFPDWVVPIMTKALS